LIFFKKKKPSLASFIPDEFADIHSHILPGLDDGSKSLPETVELIHAMKTLGFGPITTTPHVIANLWNNTPEKINLEAEKVKQHLNEINLTIPLHTAAEYMMDASFFQNIHSEKLLTVKDFYVLVEMSYLAPPAQLYDLIYEVQVAGYKPILAHPERYLFYYSRFEEYKKLKKAGCLFQLNLLSTTGYYGEIVSKLAQKLLEHDFIDFVGSDMHHQKHAQAFYNPITIKAIEPLEVAFQNNQLFKF
jgi:protein-tyrosine phosphatase